MGFNFKRLNVLVAEDTAPMRDLICGVLDNLDVGFVYTAAEGHKAFEVFQRESNDIIIADWQMDGMNGLDLTKEVRNNPLSPNRLVPIILVTGYSAMSRVGKARDVGVTEFLVKPFSANDMAKRLAYVINKPRDFIDAPDYFGPDRRRHVNPEFKGPYRRKGDPVV